MSDDGQIIFIATFLVVPLFWFYLEVSAKSCRLRSGQEYRCISPEACAQTGSDWETKSTPCGPSNKGVCCKVINIRNQPRCGVRIRRRDFFRQRDFHSPLENFHGSTKSINYPTKEIEIRLIENDNSREETTLKDYFLSNYKEQEFQKKRKYKPESDAVQGRSHIREKNNKNSKKDITTEITFKVQNEKIDERQNNFFVPTFTEIATEKKNNNFFENVPTVDVVATFMTRNATTFQAFNNRVSEYAGKKNQNKILKVDSESRDEKVFDVLEHTFPDIAVRGVNKFFPKSTSKYEETTNFVTIKEIEKADKDYSEYAEETDSNNNDETAEKEKNKKVSEFLEFLSTKSAEYGANKSVSKYEDATTFVISKEMEYKDTHEENSKYTEKTDTNATHEMAEGGTNKKESEFLEFPSIKSAEYRANERASKYEDATTIVISKEMEYKDTSEKNSKYTEETDPNATHETAEEGTNKKVPEFLEFSSTKSTKYRVDERASKYEDASTFMISRELEYEYTNEDNFKYTEEKNRNVTHETAREGVNKEVSEILKFPSTENAVVGVNESTSKYEDMTTFGTTREIEYEDNYKDYFKYTDEIDPNATHETEDEGINKKVSEFLEFPYAKSAEYRTNEGASKYENATTLVISKKMEYKDTHEDNSKYTEETNANAPHETAEEDINRKVSEFLEFPITKSAEYTANETASKYEDATTFVVSNEMVYKATHADNSKYTEETDPNATHETAEEGTNKKESEFLEFPSTKSAEYSANENASEYVDVTTFVISNEMEYKDTHGDNSKYTEEIYANVTHETEDEGINKKVSEFLEFLSTEIFDDGLNERASKYEDATTFVISKEMEYKDTHEENSKYTEETDTNATHETAEEGTIKKESEFLEFPSTKSAEYRANEKASKYEDATTFTISRELEYEYTNEDNFKYTEEKHRNVTHETAREGVNKEVSEILKFPSTENAVVGVNESTSKYEDMTTFGTTREIKYEDNYKDYFKYTDEIDPNATHETEDEGINKKVSEFLEFPYAKSAEYRTNEGASKYENATTLVISKKMEYKDTHEDNSKYTEETNANAPHETAEEDINRKVSEFLESPPTKSAEYTANETASKYEDATTFVVSNEMVYKATHADNSKYTEETDPNATHETAEEGTNKKESEFLEFPSTKSAEHRANERASKYEDATTFVISNEMVYKNTHGDNSKYTEETDANATHETVEEAINRKVSEFLELPSTEIFDDEVNQSASKYEDASTFMISKELEYEDTNEENLKYAQGTDKNITHETSEEGTHIDVSDFLKFPSAKSAEYRANGTASKYEDAPTFVISKEMDYKDTNEENFKYTEETDSNAPHETAEIGTNKKVSEFLEFPSTKSAEYSANENASEYVDVTTFVISNEMEYKDTHGDNSKYTEEIYANVTHETEDEGINKKVSEFLEFLSTEIFDDGLNERASKYEDATTFVISKEMEYKDTHEENSNYTEETDTNGTHETAEEGTIKKESEFLEFPSTKSAEYRANEKASKYEDATTFTISKELEYEYTNEDNFKYTDEKNRSVTHEIEENGTKKEVSEIIEFPSTENAVVGANESASKYEVMTTFVTTRKREYKDNYKDYSKYTEEIDPNATHETEDEGTNKKVSEFLEFPSTKSAEYRANEKASKYEDATTFMISKELEYEYTNEDNFKYTEEKNRNVTHEIEENGTNKEVSKILEFPSTENAVVGANESASKYEAMTTFVTTREIEYKDNYKDYSKYTEEIDPNATHETEDEGTNKKVSEFLEFPSTKSAEYRANEKASKYEDATTFMISKELEYEYTNEGNFKYTEEIDPNATHETEDEGTNKKVSEFLEFPSTKSAEYRANEKASKYEDATTFMISKELEYEYTNEGNFKYTEEIDPNATHETEDEGTNKKVSEFLEFPSTKSAEYRANEKASKYEDATTFMISKELEYEYTNEDNFKYTEVKNRNVTHEIEKNGTKKEVSKILDFPSTENAVVGANESASKYEVMTTFGTTREIEYKDNYKDYSKYTEEIDPNATHETVDEGTNKKISEFLDFPSKKSAEYRANERASKYEDATTFMISKELEYEYTNEDNFKYTEEKNRNVTHETAREGTNKEVSEVLEFPSTENTVVGANESASKYEDMPTFVTTREIEYKDNYKDYFKYTEEIDPNATHETEDEGTNKKVSEFLDFPSTKSAEYRANERASKYEDATTFVIPNVMQLKETNEDNSKYAEETDTNATREMAEEGTNRKVSEFLEYSSTKSAKYIANERASKYEDATTFVNPKEMKIKETNEDNFKYTGETDPNATHETAEEGTNKKAPEFLQFPSPEISDDGVNESASDYEGASTFMISKEMEYEDTDENDLKYAEGTDQNITHEKQEEGTHKDASEFLEFPSTKNDVYRAKETKIKYANASTSVNSKEMEKEDNNEDNFKYMDHDSNIKHEKAEESTNKEVSEFVEFSTTEIAIDGANESASKYEGATTLVNSKSMEYEYTNEENFEYTERMDPNITHETKEEETNEKESEFLEFSSTKSAEYRSNERASKYEDASIFMNSKGLEYKDTSEENSKYAEETDPNATHETAEEGTNKKVSEFLEFPSRMSSEYRANEKKYEDASTFMISKELEYKYTNEDNFKYTEEKNRNVTHEIEEEGTNKEVSEILEFPSTENAVVGANESASKYEVMTTFVTTREIEYEDTYKDYSKYTVENDPNSTHVTPEESRNIKNAEFLGLVGTKIAGLGEYGTSSESAFKYEGATGFVTLNEVEYEETNENYSKYVKEIDSEISHEIEEEGANKDASELFELSSTETVVEGVNENSTESATDFEDTITVLKTNGFSDKDFNNQEVEYAKDPQLSTNIEGNAHKHQEISELLFSTFTKVDIEDKSESTLKITSNYKNTTFTATNEIDYKDTNEKFMYEDKTNPNFTLEKEKVDSGKDVLKSLMSTSEDIAIEGENKSFYEHEDTAIFSNTDKMADQVFNRKENNADERDTTETLEEINENTENDLSELLTRIPAKTAVKSENDSSLESAFKFTNMTIFINEEDTENENTGEDEFKNPEGKNNLSNSGLQEFVKNPQIIKIENEAIQGRSNLYKEVAKDTKKETNLKITPEVVNERTDANESELSVPSLTEIIEAKNENTFESISKYNETTTFMTINELTNDVSNKEEALYAEKINTYSTLEMEKGSADKEIFKFLVSTSAEFSFNEENERLFESVYDNEATTTILATDKVVNQVINNDESNSLGNNPKAAHEETKESTDNEILELLRTIITQTAEERENKSLFESTYKYGDSTTFLNIDKNKSQVTIEKSNSEERHPNDTLEATNESTGNALSELSMPTSTEIDVEMENERSLLIASTVQDITPSVTRNETANEGTFDSESDAVQARSNLLKEKIQNLEKEITSEAIIETRDKYISELLMPTSIEVAVERKDEELLERISTFQDMTNFVNTNETTEFLGSTYKGIVVRKENKSDFQSASTFKDDRSFTNANEVPELLGLKIKEISAKKEKEHSLISESTFENMISFVSEKKLGNEDSTKEVSKYAKEANQTTSHVMVNENIYKIMLEFSKPTSTEIDIEEKNETSFETVHTSKNTRSLEITNEMAEGTKEEDSNYAEVTYKNTTPGVEIKSTEKEVFDALVPVSEVPVSLVPVSAVNTVERENESLFESEPTFQNTTNFVNPNELKNVDSKKHESKYSEEENATITLKMTEENTDKDVSQLLQSISPVIAVKTQKEILLENAHKYQESTTFGLSNEDFKKHESEFNQEISVSNSIFKFPEESTDKIKIAIQGEKKNLFENAYEYDVSTTFFNGDETENHATSKRESTTEERNLNLTFEETTHSVQNELSELLETTSSEIDVEMQYEHSLLTISTLEDTASFVTRNEMASVGTFVDESKYAAETNAVSNNTDYNFENTIKSIEPENEAVQVRSNLFKENVKNLDKEITPKTMTEIERTDKEFSELLVPTSIAVVVERKDEESYESTSAFQDMTNFMNTNESSGFFGPTSKAIIVKKENESTLQSASTFKDTSSVNANEESELVWFTFKEPSVEGGDESSLISASTFENITKFMTENKMANGDTKEEYKYTEETNQNISREVVNESSYITIPEFSIHTSTEIDIEKENDSSFKTVHTSKDTKSFEVSSEMTKDTKEKDSKYAEDARITTTLDVEIKSTEKEVFYSLVPIAAVNESLFQSESTFEDTTNVVTSNEMENESSNKDEIKHLEEANSNITYKMTEEYTDKYVSELLQTISAEKAVKTEKEISFERAHKYQESTAFVNTYDLSNKDLKKNESEFAKVTHLSTIDISKESINQEISELSLSTTTEISVAEENDTAFEKISKNNETTIFVGINEWTNIPKKEEFKDVEMTNSNPIFEFSEESTDKIKITIKGENESLFGNTYDYEDSTTFLNGNENENQATSKKESNTEKRNLNRTLEETTDSVENEASEVLETTSTEIDVEMKNKHSLLTAYTLENTGRFSTRNEMASVSTFKEESKYAAETITVSNNRGYNFEKTIKSIEPENEAVQERSNLLKEKVKNVQKALTPKTTIEIETTDKDISKLSVPTLIEAADERKDEELLESTSAIQDMTNFVSTNETSESFGRTPKGIVVKKENKSTFQSAFTFKDTSSVNANDEPQLLWIKFKEPSVEGGNESSLINTSTFENMTEFMTESKMSNENTNKEVSQYTEEADQNSHEVMNESSYKRVTEFLMPTTTDIAIENETYIETIHTSKDTRSFEITNEMAKDTKEEDSKYAEDTNTTTTHEGEIKRTEKEVLDLLMPISVENSVERENESFFDSESAFESTTNFENSKEMLNEETKKDEFKIAETTNFVSSNTEHFIQRNRINNDVKKVIVQGRNKLPKEVGKYSEEESNQKITIGMEKESIDQEVPKFLIPTFTKSAIEKEYRSIFDSSSEYEVTTNVFNTIKKEDKTSNEEDSKYVEETNENTAIETVKRSTDKKVTELLVPISTEVVTERENENLYDNASAVEDTRSFVITNEMANKDSNMDDKNTEIPFRKTQKEIDLEESVVQDRSYLQEEIGKNSEEIINPNTTFEFEDRSIQKSMLNSEVKMPSATLISVEGENEGSFGSASKYTDATVFVVTKETVNDYLNKEKFKYKLETNTTTTILKTAEKNTTKETSELLVPTSTEIVMEKENESFYESASAVEGTRNFVNTNEMANKDTNKDQLNYTDGLNSVSKNTEVSFEETQNEIDLEESAVHDRSHIQEEIGKHPEETINPNTNFESEDKSTQKSMSEIIVPTATLISVEEENESSFRSESEYNDATVFVITNETVIDYFNKEESIYELETNPITTSKVSEKSMAKETFEFLVPTSTEIVTERENESFYESASTVEYTRSFVITNGIANKDSNKDQLKYTDELNSISKNTEISFRETQKEIDLEETAVQERSHLHKGIGKNSEEMINPNAVFEFEDRSTEKSMLNSEVKMRTATLISVEEENEIPFRNASEHTDATVFVVTKEFVNGYFNKEESIYELERNPTTTLKASEKNTIKETPELLLPTSTEIIMERENESFYESASAVEGTISFVSTNEMANKDSNNDEFKYTEELNSVSKNTENPFQKTQKDLEESAVQDRSHLQEEIGKHSKETINPNTTFEFKDETTDKSMSEVIVPTATLISVEKENESSFKTTFKYESKINLVNEPEMTNNDSTQEVYKYSEHTDMVSNNTEQELQDNLKNIELGNAASQGRSNLSIEMDKYLEEINPKAILDVKNESTNKSIPKHVSTEIYVEGESRSSSTFEATISVVNISEMKTENSKKEEFEYTEETYLNNTLEVANEITDKKVSELLEPIFTEVTAEEENENLFKIASAFEDTTHFVTAKTNVDSNKEISKDVEEINSKSSLVVLNERAYKTLFELSAPTSTEIDAKMQHKTFLEYLSQRVDNFTFSPSKFKFTANSMNLNEFANETSIKKESSYPEKANPNTTNEAVNENTLKEVSKLSVLSFTEIAMEEQNENSLGRASNFRDATSFSNINEMANEYALNDMSTFEEKSNVMSDAELKNETSSESLGTSEEYISLQDTIYVVNNIPRIDHKETVSTEVSEFMGKKKPTEDITVNSSKKTFEFEENINLDSTIPIAIENYNTKFSINKDGTNLKNSVQGVNESKNKEEFQTLMDTYLAVVTENAFSVDELVENSKETSGILFSEGEIFNANNDMTTGEEIRLSNTDIKFYDSRENTNSEIIDVKKNNATDGIKFEYPVDNNRSLYVETDIANIDRITENTADVDEMFDKNFEITSKATLQLNHSGTEFDENKGTLNSQIGEKEFFSYLSDEVLENLTTDVNNITNEALNEDSSEKSKLFFVEDKISDKNFEINNNSPESEIKVAENISYVTTFAIENYNTLEKMYEYLTNDTKSQTAMNHNTMAASYTPLNTEDYFGDSKKTERIFKQYFTYNNSTRELMANTTDKKTEDVYKIITQQYSKKDVLQTESVRISANPKEHIVKNMKLTEKNVDNPSDFKVTENLFRNKEILENNYRYKSEYTGKSINEGNNKWQNKLTSQVTPKTFAEPKLFLENSNAYAKHGNTDNHQVYDANMGETNKYYKDNTHFHRLEGPYRYYNQNMNLVPYKQIYPLAQYKHPFRNFYGNWPVICRNFYQPVLNERKNLIYRAPAYLPRYYYGSENFQPYHQLYPNSPERISGNHPIAFPQFNFYRQPNPLYRMIDPLQRNFRPYYESEIVRPNIQSNPLMYNNYNLKDVQKNPYMAHPNFYQTAFYKQLNAMYLSESNYRSYYGSQNSYPFIHSNPSVQNDLYFKSKYPFKNNNEDQYRDFIKFNQARLYHNPNSMYYKPNEYLPSNSNYYHPSFAKRHLNMVDTFDKKEQFNKESDESQEKQRDILNFGRHSKSHKIQHVKGGRSHNETNGSGSLNHVIHKRRIELPVIKTKRNKFAIFKNDILDQERTDETFWKAYREFIGLSGLLHLIEYPPPTKEYRKRIFQNQTLDKYNKKTNHRSILDSIMNKTDNISSNFYVVSTTKKNTTRKDQQGQNENDVIDQKESDTFRPIYKSKIMRLEEELKSDKTNIIRDEKKIPISLFKMQNSSQMIKNLKKNNLKRDFNEDTSTFNDVQNNLEFFLPDTKLQKINVRRSNKKSHVNQGQTIGGELEYEPWPWIVSIYRVSDMFHVCSGTLIDNIHILTAAHCYVDISSESFVASVGNLMKISDPSQGYKVQEVIIHKNFSKSCYCNDIALIRLLEPVDSRFTPICLPAFDTAVVGENATLLGWGDRKFMDGAGMSGSDRLQRVNDLPITSSEVCRKIFSSILHKTLPSSFEKSYICAGVPHGSKDACTGDSGGPLLHLSYDGSWTLLGIVSFGYRCGTPNVPGIYTRVTYFLPWIFKAIDDYYLSLVYM